MATQRNIEFISHKFILNRICKKFLQKDDFDNDNNKLIMMLLITIIIRTEGLVCFGTLLSYTF
jgi:hypothetical protein